MLLSMFSEATFKIYLTKNDKNIFKVVVTSFKEALVLMTKHIPDKAAHKGSMQKIKIRWVL